MTAIPIRVETSEATARECAYKYYPDAAPIIERVLHGSRACKEGRILAWTRGAAEVQRAIDAARAAAPVKRHGAKRRRT